MISYRHDSAAARPRSVAALVPPGGFRLSRAAAAEPAPVVAPVYSATVLAPIRRLLTLAAEALGVTLDHLQGPRSAREIAHKRQLAMLVAYERLPGASLPQIGRALHRDHTTILYGVRVARQRLETDAAARALYDQIIARLEAA